MDKALVGVLWLVGISFLYAFVFWRLWAWFVVPLGAPALSYWHAYGLSLFGSWLETLGAILPKGGIESGWTYRVSKVLALLIIWGFGAAAQAMM